MDKVRLRAYIYLILNAAIWGAGLPIVKKALEDTTAFRFLFYRFFIACFFAVPMILISYPKIRNKVLVTLRIFALEIIGLTISLGLLYYGLSQTTSIEAGLISTTGPLFIVLGGIVFYKEVEEKNELAGLIIALIGTIIITLEPLVNQGADVSFSLFGNMIILGQNVISAFYFLMIKREYKGLPAIYPVAISFFVGMISFLLISIVEVGSVGEFTSSVGTDLNSFWVIFASAFMAVGGSVFALTLLIKAQNMIEISEATLFGYLQPIFYLPLGVLWLDEQITLTQLIGLALVLSGVAMASRRRV